MMDCGVLAYGAAVREGEEAGDMESNVFLEDARPLVLKDYMSFKEGSRENLGMQIPVVVYRLLEYSLREQLCEQFGKKVQVEIFRKAGRRAGVYFAENLLDLKLPKNEFIAMLQSRMEELGIGILRIEKVEESGRIVLTVAEDADCSGLPLLGEAVCNYDEGFLSGIFSVYTGKDYSAVEIDCWATGDRVCRFCAEIADEEAD